MGIGVIFTVLFFLEKILYGLVALAGIAGTISAAMTRDDAFDAADRQSKTIWVVLLAASSIALVLTTVTAGAVFMLSIIGAVVIGVYWCDVRPQIRSILNGTYGF
ncbi:DUF2516 family protein [Corynebacterium massiliense]|uniref:DUF2516 domain-containing protein n=1 Tax=Corynebacterium massiliense DSM 45435 TaxID=1121364 RepID=A0ABY7U4U6_9CORY|nr:DUF2516 family protein [Corynebacterium massiliense]WCZ31700.1 hypothetical protein CMASS_01185 [Corynebacterium massiliense DSM 45435]